MSHIILYSTGLGDRSITSRQRLISFWLFRNMQIRFIPNNWKVDEPVEAKLSRLLAAIDEEFAKGNHVSLIGESAGASMVTQALLRRGDRLSAIILLCGKFQYPEKLAAGYTSLNPALKPAVQESVKAVSQFNSEHKAKILNLHPFLDPIVPVYETKIPGIRSSTMPIIGHATAIVFAMTIWSWKIVHFVRNRAKERNRKS